MVRKIEGSKNRDSNADDEVGDDDDHRSEVYQLIQLKKMNLKNFRLRRDSNPLSLRLYPCSVIHQLPVGSRIDQLVTYINNRPTDREIDLVVVDALFNVLVCLLDFYSIPARRVLYFISLNAMFLSVNREV